MNCFLDQTAPYPRSHPRFEDAVLFATFLDRGSKTLFSVFVICCQQKGKKVERLHVFSKHLAEVS